MYRYLLVFLFTIYACMIAQGVYADTFCDVSANFGQAFSTTAIAVSNTNNRGFYLDTRLIDSISTTTVYLKGTTGTGSLKIYSENATTSPVYTTTFNANTSNVETAFTFSTNIDTSTSTFYRFEFTNSVSTAFYITGKYTYNIDPVYLETYYSLDRLCRSSENTADGLSIDNYHPKVTITGTPHPTCPTYDSCDDIEGCVDESSFECPECETCHPYTDSCNEMVYSNDLSVITGCTQVINNETSSTTETQIQYYHVPFFVFIVLFILLILIFSRIVIELIKRFK